MALTEKSRSALYQGLTTIADEQAVQEMLSYFPARDVEEPVTKEFLRAELSDVEHSIRTDMSAMEAGIRSDMTAMEIRLTDKISRALIWSIGANTATMVAMAAVIITAVRM